ncbi:MAG: hypothetical protein PHH86_10125 [Sphaerochaetaceae bacterium]|nr:hypothetical protein [Sphaerochaetaceae bacterium]
MFTFALMLKWPWEDNIAPDWQNDELELYIETHFTKEVRQKHGKPLKGFEQWYVAMVRFKDGKHNWIISDGTGKLDEATSIEALGINIDKWHLVMGARE